MRNLCHFTLLIERVAMRGTVPAIYEGATNIYL